MNSCVVRILCVGRGDGLWNKKKIFPWFEQCQYIVHFEYWQRKGPSMDNSVYYKCCTHKIHYTTNLYMVKSVDLILR